MEMALGVGVTACDAAYVERDHVMSWGTRAIEIHSTTTGEPAGIFRHKRAMKASLPLAAGFGGLFLLLHIVRWQH
jgi:hypothetical protein